MLITRTHNAIILGTSTIYVRNGYLYRYVDKRRLTLNVRNPDLAFKRLCNAFELFYSRTEKKTNHMGEQEMNVTMDIYFILTTFLLGHGNNCITSVYETNDPESLASLHKLCREEQYRTVDLLLGGSNNKMSSFITSVKRIAMIK